MAPRIVPVSAIMVLSIVVALASTTVFAGARASIRVALRVTPHVSVNVIAGETDTPEGFANDYCVRASFGTPVTLSMIPYSDRTEPTRTTFQTICEGQGIVVSGSARRLLVQAE